LNNYRRLNKFKILSACSDFGAVDMRIFECYKSAFSIIKAYVFIYNLTKKRILTGIDKIDRIKMKNNPVIHLAQKSEHNDN